MPEHADSRRLPEDAAHRLLARAVELDSARGTELTIEQLRAAASEAGISAVAFEAAVGEWLVGGLGAAPERPVPATRRGRVHRWVDAPLKRLRVVLIGAPVRNLVAFAAFWGVLAILVSLDRSADVHWLVRKATDPLALGIGAALAARLRARPVALLLTGLAVSQGAEFVMDAMLRTPSVQGFGSHLALMIAGVLGVLIGGRAFRGGRDGVADATASALAASRTQGPAPLIRARLLQLAHVVPKVDPLSAPARGA